MLQCLTEMLTIFLVFQVYTGAEQCHQLVFILGNVPLHDVHAGAQQTLESLDVDYWNKNTDISHEVMQRINMMLSKTSLPLSKL